MTMITSRRYCRRPWRGFLLTTLFLLWITTEAWILPLSFASHRRYIRVSPLFVASDERKGESPQSTSNGQQEEPPPPQKSSTYDLGLGKNPQVGGDSTDEPTKHDIASASLNWNVPTPVEKPPEAQPRRRAVVPKTSRGKLKPIRTKKLVARTEATKKLQGAVYDENHHKSLFLDERESEPHVEHDTPSPTTAEVPALLFSDIDLSIPPSVYSNTTDAVWDLLRYEAYIEAQREPLLVSFLHSTILNHASLESALAFHLANRLSSPAMISTQIQALILEALQNSPEFRRSLRADVCAVRDRDPACTCLPDAFLYFKVSLSKVLLKLLVPSFNTLTACFLFRSQGLSRSSNTSSGPLHVPARTSSAGPLFTITGITKLSN